MKEGIALELKKYDRIKVAFGLFLALVSGVWVVVDDRGLGARASLSGILNGAVGRKQEPSGVTAVSVSHPQLLIPAKGSEIEYGFVQFEGIANTGTKVVVYGDGAEMGSAFATQRGRFMFDIKVVPPLAKVYSISYFTAGGTQIIGERDLGLRVIGEYELVSRPFAIFRPVDDGSLRMGESIIAGTGKPGSRVKLQIDEWQLGMADVKDDGTWTFTRTVSEVGVERQLTAREIEGYGDEIIVHTIAIIE
ncbi:MAG: hypothetical protein ACKVQS_13370 [Fimbriimonadaceae bacterium]